MFFKWDGNEFQSLEPRYLNELYPYLYVLNFGCNNLLLFRKS